MYNQIKEFVGDYPSWHGKDKNLFLINLIDKGFNDTQILDIINTINGICLHCFDNTSSCQCWNDD